MRSPGRAAKKKYNHTIGRIQNGEKWLQEHGKDHPEYQRTYDGYLALYEKMRKLYVAISEPLAELMEGYADEQ